LSFDGVDDFVGAGNATVLRTPAGTTFTYMAWIRGLPGQLPHEMFINRWLPYFQAGGSLHFSLWAAGAQRSAWGTTPLAADRWYHAAATYDAAGHMRVFLDGILDGTAGPFLPIDNQGDAMRFGRHQTGGTAGSHHYRGLIDEVRIYNRALSASEIAAIYAATK
jgi:hypothetical protein